MLAWIWVSRTLVNILIATLCLPPSLAIAPSIFDTLAVDTLGFFVLLLQAFIAIFVAVFRTHWPGKVCTMAVTAEWEKCGGQEAKIQYC